MKRFIAILLCAVMLCGLVPAFAVQASQTGQSTDYMGFSDLKGHWAEEALTHAVENGLLKGYDGKLSPNDALTRAQLATIVVSAFGATEKADISHLTDVPEDAWYYTYVQKAVAMGALKGDEGGTFRPEDKVSREEAFTVFDSLLMLGSGNTSVLNSFTDADQVSGWARPMVSAIVEAGLAVGNQGKLNPKSSITRAEFATIIYRAISEYGRNQSITLDKADSLAVTAPNAVVKGTKVTGDLYITEGVGDTEIVLDGVTVGGRLVIRSGSVIILKNGASISGKTIILDGLDAQVKNEQNNTTTGGSTGGSSGGSGGSSSSDKYTVVGKYTYDQVENLFSDEDLQGTVKQYVKFLRDPSYDTTNDANISGLDLINTETFVNKDFTIHPSLFASLRNVASSTLSENRQLLWLAYTAGGVDCVNLSTGKITSFAADELTGGENLLLVGNADTTSVYVITTDGVTLIAR